VHLDHPTQFRKRGVAHGLNSDSEIGLADSPIQTSGRGAMSIECAFYGFLAADAPRTSQAGNPWTRSRVRRALCFDSQGRALGPIGAALDLLAVQS
jgi:hypothetical protein